MDPPVRFWHSFECYAKFAKTETMIQKYLKVHTHSETMTVCTSFVFIPEM